MDASSFRSTARGHVRRTLEGYAAFFPEPLPRRLDLSGDTVLALDQATAAVSRLAGISAWAPALPASPNIRLEAVLSSRIEGTQATVSDLLRHEAGASEGGPTDAPEVANYVTALDHGMERLRGRFPLSLRLIREMHERLLSGVRGYRQAPGEFRHSQNWIGGRTPSDAVFVPPPVDEMQAALADLERFLHTDGLPVLVRAALAHYQFEVVHPFLDGNGRIGRLLIPLILHDREMLEAPLLYVSAFFERQRDDYYRLLLATSQDGDLTPWLRFFLHGVAVTARDAEQRMNRLLDYQASLRFDLERTRAPSSAIRLVDLVARRPVLTVKQVADELGVSIPTAQKAVDALGLTEVTGRRRGRVYEATELLEVVYGEPFKVEAADADTRLSGAGRSAHAGGDSG